MKERFTFKFSKVYYLPENRVNIFSFAEMNRIGILSSHIIYKGILLQFPNDKKYFVPLSKICNGQDFIEIIMLDPKDIPIVRKFNLDKLNLKNSL